MAKVDVKGFGPVNSGLPSKFDQFGDAMIQVVVPQPDGYSVSFQEVRVAEQYKKLVSEAEQAEKSGNPMQYFDAVYNLAKLVGNEMGESTKGRGSNDLVNTIGAAARSLRDMPHSEDNINLITTGQDWTAKSDTLQNQGWAHPVDDVINSTSFGNAACEMINFRGCGFVTAQLVNSEYNPRGRQNSPKMVEVRVKGFKKPEPVAKRPYDIPEGWTLLD